MELQAAVTYLRSHHGTAGLIRMRDLQRAALAISGRFSTARKLRDRLVASACLVVDTALGRAAAYVLTPDAEACIAIADDSDDAAPEAGDPWLDAMH